IRRRLPVDLNDSPARHQTITRCRRAEFEVCDINALGRDAALGADGPVGRLQRRTGPLHYRVDVAARQAGRLHAQRCLTAHAPDGGADFFFLGHGALDIAELRYRLIVDRQQDISGPQHPRRIRAAHQTRNAEHLARRRVDLRDALHPRIAETKASRIRERLRDEFGLERMQWQTSAHDIERLGHELARDTAVFLHQFAPLSETKVAPTPRPRPALSESTPTKSSGALTSEAASRLLSRNMTERDSGSCNGLTSAMVVVRDLITPLPSMPTTLTVSPGLSSSVASFAARTAVVPMSFGS